MSKKMGKRIKGLDDALIKEILRMEQKVKSVRSYFYENERAVKFDFPAVGGDAFDSLYEEKHEYDAEEEKCDEIRQNVLEGKRGNAVVLFDKGMVQFSSGQYSLANTIAHIRIAGNFQYVFFNAGDRYDARIFIGGSPIEAFLVLKDKEDGKGNVVLPLDDFAMFSICDNMKKGEANGLMVDFDQDDEELSYYFLQDVFFGPVRDLLSSDYLQMGWAKVKKENEKKKENTAEKRSHV